MSAATWRTAWPPTVTIIFIFAVKTRMPHATTGKTTFGATVVQERVYWVVAPSFTFDLNGMRFLVSGRAEGENPVKSGSDPRYGLDHFGLIVDDMDSAAADLRAKGVEFICEPWEIRPGVKIAFVKGPDDISIELAQRNE